MGAMDGSTGMSGCCGEPGDGGGQGVIASAAAPVSASAPAPGAHGAPLGTGLGFDIDPDVGRASTLPARVYRDPGIYACLRERVFARTWHYLCDASAAPGPGDAAPVTLLEGCLDEPLALVRDEAGEARVLSNVCTHRGNLVCTATQSGARSLACGYHGRRFELDGRFRSMPEFEATRDFPSRADDLPRVPHGALGAAVFAALDPKASFADLLAPVLARVGYLEPDRFVPEPAGARAFTVEANWALYCDNYLEGFHIPWVHPALNQTLDYGLYRTEAIPHGVLQVGIAREGEPAFELPAGHPDAGQRVAAYYFWLFPTTMLNFYPWGLSLNAVVPLGPERCRVVYRAYVRDPARRGQGAGGDLDSVELEDERVVEQVMRGVRSRLYDRGRYSPSREQGVHRFHRLLAGFVAAGGASPRTSA